LPLFIFHSEIVRKPEGWEGSKSRISQKNCHNHIYFFAFGEKAGDDSDPGLKSFFTYRKRIALQLQLKKYKIFNEAIKPEISPYAFRLLLQGLNL
jgi:hypothetical protein